MIEYSLDVSCGSLCKLEMVGESAAMEVMYPHEVGYLQTLYERLPLLNETKEAEVAGAILDFFSVPREFEDEREVSDAVMRILSKY